MPKSSCWVLVSLPLIIPLKKVPFLPEYILSALILDVHGPFTFDNYIIFYLTLVCFSCLSFINGEFVLLVSDGKFLFSLPLYFMLYLDTNF